MNSLRHIVELGRPKSWIKNAIVLFPVIAAKRASYLGDWGQALLAAGAFCLASSAMYVVNDLRDRSSDREHPHKKNRPLAAGTVTPSAAIVEAIVLLVGALALATLCGWSVVWVVLAYVVLQFTYTFYLKRKVLLDVICIAIGFVLRAGAGAIAISVKVSPWLVVCTFTACLFMGFCKRCNEIVTIGDPHDARRHRRTLLAYTPELLTHLITISAAVAILAFLLYASSGRTKENIGSIGLIYTLPLFIYAVFRFAMLSMIGRYADPTDLMLRDRPFQLTVLLWVAAAMAVIRWGNYLPGWLD